MPTTVLTKSLTDRMRILAYPYPYQFRIRGSAVLPLALSGSSNVALYLHSGLFINRGRLRQPVKASQHSEDTMIIVLYEILIFNVIDI